MVPKISRSRRPELTSLVGDDGLVEMGGQVALPCFKKFMLQGSFFGERALLFLRPKLVVVFAQDMNLWDRAKC